jgi:formylmethanofuran dehydrogenase subunit A
MIIELAGGSVFDPANGLAGETRDLVIADGQMAAATPDAKADRRYDLRGLVVMPGAIDIHSHIAGGKVNLARLMMSEEHRDSVTARSAMTRSGSGVASPTSFVTGYRYA